METAYLIAFAIVLLGLVVLIIGTASYLLRKSNIDADFEELEQAQVSAVNQDIVEFTQPEPVADPVKPKAKRKAAKKKAAKKSVKKKGEI